MDASGALKLSALSRRPVHLLIDASTGTLHLGHQYLLIIIPFGRVALQDPTQFIFDRAFEALAIRGFRVDNNNAAFAPTVRLQLEDLSVTAYDLLFTRRLRASIKLSLTTASADDTPLLHCSAQSEESTFARFGFAPQLTQVLQRALDKALNEVLSCADGSMRRT